MSTNREPKRARRVGRRRSTHRMMPETVRKVGHPPGTVIYAGEERTDPARITLIDYDQDRLEERELSRVEEALPFRDSPTVTWLNVDGVHDVEMLHEIGDLFGLHPLVLEDIASTGQRPKMEDYEEYVYVVVKMLTYDEEARHVVDEQVSLVLGPHYVISLQERAGDVFDEVRTRLRSPDARGRRLGPDYLAYRLMDATVDHYFLVLERLGDRLAEVEDDLVESPGEEILHEIYRMKRELLFLRKSVWPLREVLAGVVREESGLITDATRAYFRDIYDHTIQVVDTTETFRDIVAGMLDTYLSSLSNRMNEVMKVLTIIATTFIPLTFVAGVYGMNFEYMPELSLPWAYPAVWAVMIAVSVAMLLYFRRKDWL